MNRLFGIGQPKICYNKYDRDIQFDQGTGYLKFRPGEELLLELVRSVDPAAGLCSNSPRCCLHCYNAQATLHRPRMPAWKRRVSQACVCSECTHTACHTCTVHSRPVRPRGTTDTMRCAH